MRKCRLFLTSSLLLAFAFLANSDIIRVPDDQPTIQAGIDVALNGDTVLVADGTYRGADNKNLDPKGKAIVVQSQNGPESTIIDCEGQGRGFNFHSGETSESVVRGFTITNGSPEDGYGGAIACINSSSPAIEDNLITGNHVESSGGAIHCYDNSSPEILNNEISGNSCLVSGGGIHCYNSSSPKTTGNTINGNNVGKYGGGIYCYNNSFPEIRGNVISDNESGVFGGGISCERESSPVIANNTISGNRTGRDGGGIYCFTGCSPIIDENIITGNESVNYGGGIACQTESCATITNNAISGNYAAENGGGVSYQDVSMSEIHGNEITGNRAGDNGGGIYFDSNSDATMTNNRITGNEAVTYGGGIYLASSVKIINSTIAENMAKGSFGGGVFCAGGTSRVMNTILWGDVPDEIYVFEEAMAEVTYSDIQGGWSGEGNIDFDPRFIDAVNGDYRLSAESPCLGAGSMMDDMPQKDMNGNARPSPSDSMPDMGAYESAASPIINVTLTSPDGGEVWAGGSEHDITWEAPDPRIDHVKLLYSTVSGTDYSNIMADFTENNGSYTWSVPILDSATVRVKLQAEDGNNNVLAEDAGDDDFTIDSTPPETALALSGMPGQGDIYISDVIVTISATDNLSGVKETKFRVSGGDWVTYSSHFTVSSSAICYYYSEDNAGNIELERSTEIKIDRSSLGAPVVSDDGDFTTDGSQLHASWTMPDGGGEVAEYRYAIGTSPGGNDFVDWTWTGTDTEVTVTGLSLMPGQMYYFSVQAGDEAGRLSPAGSSDGITYGIPGDINADGEIHSDDAIIALRISAEILQPDDYQKWAADINTDGRVRSNDAILILRKAVGLATPGMGMLTRGGGHVTLSLGMVDIPRNSKISVPLRIKDSIEVVSGDLRISYDPEILQAVDVSSDNGILLVSDLSESGKLKIAFAGTNRLDTEILIKLEFERLMNDVSGLQIENAELYGLDALPLVPTIISRRLRPRHIPEKGSALLQNFPNPFNPETWIPYQLEKDSDVTIEIYSTSGSLIRELHLGYRRAGYYTACGKAAYWDGKDESGEEVASGTYFYILKAGNFAACRKMVILR